ncbi:MAG: 50S ribosomal protein L21 [Deltaproteobacteria bacterium]|nr:50S ribosomal protein L21 [Deltaproteobacteria bacterium]
MYAVVNTGGKQYKVQQGEVLRVEKISGDVGSPVTFDRVLMFSDGENVSIGQPVLENIAVEGHIVEQGKAKKIIVFKYKKRKRYRRKKGHRQEFTAVQIDNIKAQAAEVREASESRDKPETEAKTETEAIAKKVEGKKAEPDKETSEKPEAKKAAPQKADTKNAESKKAATEKVEAGKIKAKEAETKKAESKEEAKE